MVIVAFLALAGTGRAQVDPEHRNLLEFGYDLPLVATGPQATYLYYHYNNPDFLGTNMALRVAVAPAYFDGELGIRHVIFPYTDIGIGLSGGGFADDYYEVRQGNYLKGESFDGHSAGAALSLYQLLDPGFLVPLNVVVRGGIHYATYERNCDTADTFTVPDNEVSAFVRTGLRVAGREPMLYPNGVGMELSVWFERQWRFDGDRYGFNDDRAVNDACNLYWIFAGMNFGWTNIGHQVSFAVTAGGSDNADRFSAWRLGGVLPLVSEFPLVLPGYYYEELTAERFVHLYGSYEVPLDPAHRFKLRLEAAAASLKYLPGFEQRDNWQTGVGGGLSFAPRNQIFRIILRYGYGFNAIRDNREGGHSIGLLFQYDFHRQKEWRHNGS